ncbi:TlpA family protein disulfide reductase [Deinococcus fonticola]|uniref:TlpA family protein disulfide reductase n=1 Tax=Deinococcus fonticola TaxID=2528713 RepID=UPI0010754F7B|nr:TlpA disulfide reductase family protein [Deinococcus fonticola]
MRLGRTSSPLRFLPPLLAFVLVAVLALLLLRPAPGGPADGSLLGQPAPTFVLKALDGSSVDLSSFRGRPLVLNFWASWCGPCRDEAPLFRDLDARRQRGNYQVLGVLFQDSNLGNARKFVKEYRLTYPNAIDAKMDAGSAYQVSGLPQTVFIDSRGVVRHIDKGGLSRERLNEGLKKIGVSPL